ncbi:hypothetical protein DICPUDRAFT_45365 [Dictyostelium purpureum]|uniref:EF-hand domain-containing protein n=1 Tax=Dictyostelium purpureum TaxID=5786 RepID=F0ZA74_DICPU|nr:uncharacterized protein DICPUDRAFT_45365 [Dictyostelium purpureum]EGC39153.1 hypothetical protein DICPUDRAFT_45365 [Dictyostelium purpureum]|eukprot:XP_003284299.1 hypothetical protein DICPUDRAFT_45365 [Dictyostelium purpureum]
MSTLPENVVKDIEAMMSKFDKNNDGEITWDEVVERLKENKNCKDPYFAAFSMFSALDKNQDRKISLAEVQNHKLEIYAKKCESVIKRDVKNMLKEYDGNKDGKITWDEVCDFFRKDPEVGEKNCELNTKYLFQSMDKNNDKVITRDELRAFSMRFNNLHPSQ